MSTDRNRISLVTEASDGARPLVGLPQSILPGRESILLVEDEPMLRTLVRHILEVIGYNVMAAASGSEAMEICKGHDGAVHLLLTDVVMPQMSGPKLGEEVIKLRPDIGILYMSGYPENVIMRHGVSEGVPFLQKPFSPQALALKVREILDGAEQARIYDSKALSQDSSLPQLVGA